jgi:hypothetical protein
MPNNQTAIDKIKAKLDAILAARISVLVVEPGMIITRSASEGGGHCLNDSGEWILWDSGEPPVECILHGIITDAR